MTEKNKPAAETADPLKITERQEHPSLAAGIRKVEDYAIHLNTGQSVGTGIYTVNRLGKRKEVTKYQETYVTKAGRFSPQEWHDRIMEAIEEAGESLLLEKIKDHCREYCAWLHKERDIEDYAAKCLANRAYLCWEDFMEEQEIFFIG